MLMVLAMIKDPTATITCLEEFHLTITCHCFDSGRWGVRRRCNKRPLGQETLRSRRCDEIFGASTMVPPVVFWDDCRPVDGEIVFDKAVVPEDSAIRGNMAAQETCRCFDAGQQWGERGSCYKGPL